MSRVLSPREAYPLWAPTYEGCGALAALDEIARVRLDPVPGAPLLDAACGTGRRMRLEDGSRRPSTFGVDLVLEMLLAGGRGASAGPPAVSAVSAVSAVPAVPAVPPAAAVRSAAAAAVAAVAVATLDVLPFGRGIFRSAWCRLAVGHLPSLVPAYRELARVLASGGTLVVTDFHPEAVRRGMRRTFRAGGEVVEMEHHVHELAEHRRAGEESGLVLEEVLSLDVGEELRSFFERAGALHAYEEQRGTPVLLALRLKRA